MKFPPTRMVYAIEQLGLEFLDFVNLSTSVKASYDHRFTRDHSRTSLENWETLESEKTDMFAGMYQFYCRINPGEITRFPV